MKKYIVVALVCQGLGNNVFRAGEECREDNFAPGHADKLVEQGFLKLKEETAAEKEALEASEKEAAEKEAAEKEAAKAAKKK